MTIKLFFRITSRHRRDGFTIVELLIVIVVIAILAAISIVSYAGIQNRAQISTLQSNLSRMARDLELYKTQNAETYPSSLAVGSIKVPDTAVFVYQSNGNAYCLSGTSAASSYKVTDTVLNPFVGTCSGVLANGSICPSGFIAIPGNTSLGTSDFCVMKYEAKNVASVPTSQASGVPWTSVSQTTATSAASSTCGGCHLMTEEEWMTIAANILTVPSNWSSGVVGNGYVYSGHNDNNPASALSASNDDNDGYNSTGNAIGNQRRTLTLSNGEVIWDLAGNVWEWTAFSQALSNIGVPGDSSYTYREWNDGALQLGNLPGVSLPSALMSNGGLGGVTGWGSTNGIGMINANYSDTASRGFRRGGSWSNGSYSGLLALNLSVAPSYSGSGLGFRVSR